MRRPRARNAVVSFIITSSSNTRDFENLAIHKFGMPVHAPPKAKEAYLHYLKEALTTTCSPVIWPPESWSEFFNCRTASKKERPRS